MPAYSKITDYGYVSRKEIATVWALCFMRIKFRIRANKWELFDAVRKKKAWPKTALGRKEFICFTILGCSPSAYEKERGRNLRRSYHFNSQERREANKILLPDCLLT